nr:ATP-binding protein [Acholeplasmatales bacterium]
MRYLDIINEKDKNKLKKNIIDNINITNFEPFINFLKENDIELYKFFKEIERNFLDIYETKAPLIMDITDDNVINITGPSGSGKSTYSRKHFSPLEYEIIETDSLFSNTVEVSNFQNDLRKIIYDKFSDEYNPNKHNLWINIRHFNDVLRIIIENKDKVQKPLVIDSGQFRHLDDFSILKGKIIIMRTSVNESIDRAKKRFILRHPDSTEKERLDHAIRKYTEYELYKKFNTLIIRLLI